MLKGNTTNLISHLKTMHSKKYEEVKWKNKEKKQSGKQLRKNHKP